MGVNQDELATERFTERDYSEAILQLQAIGIENSPLYEWARARLTARKCNPDIAMRVVDLMMVAHGRTVTAEYAESAYQRRCHRGARQFVEEFPMSSPFGELKVSHGGLPWQSAVEQFNEAVRPIVEQAVAGVDAEPTGEVEEFNFHNWALLWVNERAPEVEAKAREYGSNSLMEMGRVFRRAQGRSLISDAEALEVGAWLYAYGKVQRIADAVLRGELPTDDQWTDTIIYGLMALYIRQANRWP